MAEKVQDKNCVYCKIISGEFTSTKVYEDENVLAFLSIEPINEGHALVIPKSHIENWLDLDETENKEIFVVAQKVAKNIKDKYNPKKVGLMIAGWDVPHTHIHVVPMDDKDDITSKKLLDKYTK
jgi:histidine triad (HIT) family protein